MKRIIYLNSRKQVLFVLVAPHDRQDGSMLTLPPLANEVLESIDLTNKISRTLYGIHVDKTEFLKPTSELTLEMSSVYRTIAVAKQDVRESKYVHVWLTKEDIKNLRQSNAQMLKDNYEIIEDVYKALI